MSRIDTATLRQATEDVLAFGVVVSEQDADQIEQTNDALSRLGLIWRGLSNQLAVAAAPALEAAVTGWQAVIAALSDYASHHGRAPANAAPSILGRASLSLSEKHNPRAYGSTPCNTPS